MSRYRANRLPAASGHAVGIEEAVNDFLLHHQRKGDSESYLRELRSYLIGGPGHFGKRRAWPVAQRLSNPFDNALNLGNISNGDGPIVFLGDANQQKSATKVCQRAGRFEQRRLIGRFAFVFEFWQLFLANSNEFQNVRFRYIASGKPIS